MLTKVSIALIFFAVALLVSFSAQAESSAWARCGIKPAPPAGYESNDAVCETKNGKAEWIWVKGFSYRCGSKPAPPEGYESKDAVCEVIDGKAEWKWIQPFSYRCGVKPAPPLGFWLDEAICKCDGHTCSWQWIKKR